MRCISQVGRYIVIVLKSAQLCVKTNKQKPNKTRKEHYLVVSFTLKDFFILFIYLFFDFFLRQCIDNATSLQCKINFLLFVNVFLLKLYNRSGQ